MIPNEISSAELLAGGTVTGNLCWSVPTSELPSLILFDSSGYDEPGPFFALH